MYPEKTWKTVSPSAISCIQHFLVVQHDARYTVDQALSDTWFNQKQCHEDIKLLEEKAILIFLKDFSKFIPMHYGQVGEKWLIQSIFEVVKKR